MTQPVENKTDKKPEEAAEPRTYHVLPKGVSVGTKGGHNTTYAPYVTGYLDLPVLLTIQGHLPGSLYQVDFLKSFKLSLTWDPVAQTQMKIGGRLIELATKPLSEQVRTQFQAFLFGSAEFQQNWEKGFSNAGVGAQLNIRAAGPVNISLGLDAGLAHSRLFDKATSTSSDQLGFQVNGMLQFTFLDGGKKVTKN